MPYAVTIIIVNWNGKPVIGQCLEGLRRQIYRDFSIIMVDNGSGDGSVEYVRQAYPEAHVISLNKNYGFCMANNVALAHVESEYAALLNNDVVAAPEWLGSLVQTLSAYPKAGSATSKFLYADRPHVIDRAGDGYSRAGVGVLRGRGMPADQWNTRQWVFGACAGASLYRTRMLQEIGFFDPHFFILYEDVDLSFRAQLQGYPCLYVPDAIVYHQASRSLGYDSDLSIYYGHRNLEWVYLKNMPLALFIRTFLLHLWYIVISGLFFGLKGRMLPFLAAKKDALKGFRRVMGLRRIIQQQKKVSDAYLWELMEPEWFFPRLIHRYKNHSRGQDESQDRTKVNC